MTGDGTLGSSLEVCWIVVCGADVTADYGAEFTMVFVDLASEIESLCLHLLDSWYGMFESIRLPSLIQELVSCFCNFF